MVNVFAVPVFFICFRESLESSIVVSILLAFLKQTLNPSTDPDGKVAYKKLVRQVWTGVILGAVITVIIGAGLIGAFYGLGKESFEDAEDLWEGILALLASVIITLMGAALLRVSKMQAKWRIKIAAALENRDRPTTKGGRLRLWAERYAMFILPFITVLREGVEAMIFVGGVGLGLPASAFPLAVICGLGGGALVGWLLYKGGNRASIQLFLIASTCILYLVAAGLFTRAIFTFEMREWKKLVGEGASESGAGPGSYDIRKTVWHVDCCSPKLNGGSGWGVFMALFGWSNTGTYGSVIGYNMYWLAVIVGFLLMRYHELHGRIPFVPNRKRSESTSSIEGGMKGNGETTVQESKATGVTELREACE